MNALRFALITLLFCLTTLTLAKDDSPFKKPKDILKDLQKMADEDPKLAAQYASPEAVYAAVVEAAKNNAAAELVLCYVPGFWIDAINAKYDLKGKDRYDSDFVAFITLDKQANFMGTLAKTALLDDEVPAKVKGADEAKKYGFTVDGQPSNGTQLFVRYGKLWFLAD